MDKLLGRGPGYVFLTRLNDRGPHWYRVETVDLLGQFKDTPKDVLPQDSDDVTMNTWHYETHYGLAD